MTAFVFGVLLGFVMGATVVVLVVEMRRTR